MPITPEQIDDIFSYHAPTEEQQECYENIRDAAKQLALVILTNTPASADQTAAIRLLRQVVATANAAVALGGKY